MNDGKEKLPLEALGLLAVLIGPYRAMVAGWMAGVFVVLFLAGLFIGWLVWAS